MSLYEQKGPITGSESGSGSKTGIGIYPISLSDKSFEIKPAVFRETYPSELLSRIEIPEFSKINPEV